MSEPSVNEMLNLLHKIDKTVATLEVKIVAMERAQLRYVSHDEFEPVKRIAYGLVGTVLTAVVLGILALIF